MKTKRLLTALAALSFLTVAAAGLLPAGHSTAAPKGPCLSRAVEDKELELAQIHTAWRNLYVPGSDPSNPLLGSAPLRAAALGLAHDLAEGTLTASAVTPQLLAERAIACGYPEGFAVGGRGIATGKGWTPEQALMLMTSEQWGPAAAIRVPTYVDGLEMRCIGIAHTSEAGATPGEAWVIIIMAGTPACPQAVSNVEPYNGGTPTATATPPFTRPTATPTATPTKTALNNSHRLFIPIAKD